VIHTLNQVIMVMVLIYPHRQWILLEGFGNNKVTANQLTHGSSERKVDSYLNFSARVRQKCLAVIPEVSET